MTLGVTSPPHVHDQASEAVRREIATQEADRLEALRKDRSRLEKAMGVVLVLTGVLFLTGSINWLGQWMIETFPVLGEDVLVSGAGPIGLMATAVVRHAGARHVVVSEPNQFRRDLAMTMGASRAVDPRSSDLHEVQRELGMVEGFDIALEMSGNAVALRSAIDNMAHGGRIAILGIPTDEISLDVNTIVFNQLTLRGIYGREMYETWYKMTVMLQSGLNIEPVITEGEQPEIVPVKVTVTEGKHRNIGRCWRAAIPGCLSSATSRPLPRQGRLAVTVAPDQRDPVVRIDA